MIVVGADGRPRCAWGSGCVEYRDYHDNEWGQPVRGDNALFERITLEAFQSGLSWLTILRKRENFRRAFADFEISAVAEFDDRDRQRLMTDASIVRNRAKIDAAIANAVALRRWICDDGPGALDRLWWSFAEPEQPRPRTTADVVASSEQSRALSKGLKARGLTFLGPVTVHAAMQATGLRNDHLAQCWVND